MRRLNSLEAWVRGRELARSAYRLTLGTPLEKHFGLADQIRRASAPIPANIAEGHALGTTPQFIRCLRIALGSATELLTHVELASDMDLVPPNRVGPVLDLCNREVGLLIGLIRTLMRRA